MGHLPSTGVVLSCFVHLTPWAGPQWIIAHGRLSVKIYQMEKDTFTVLIFQHFIQYVVPRSPEML